MGQQMEESNILKNLPWSKMSSSDPIWLFNPLLEENFISREAYGPSRPPLINNIKQ